jgi:hypothetical protein
MCASPHEKSLMFQIYSVYIKVNKGEMETQRQTKCNESKR